MNLTGRSKLAKLLANYRRSPNVLRGGRVSPGSAFSQGPRSMKIVTVHTAKTTLSQLIAAAEAGEEVIIKRGHEAVVRLVPVAPAAKREFGALAGKVSLDSAFFEPLPSEVLDAWEG